MTGFRTRQGALVLLGTALLLGACGGDETQNVRPQLVAPQDTADFGAVPVLNQKELNLEVLNVGRGALTVNSVAIQETGVPFQLLSRPEEPIGPSESQPIVVAFTPPLEQDYSATLVLETDDRDNPQVTVKLVGKGSTRAIMEVEPSSLDFGRVAEGQSAVKTLTVRSKGTADLILDDISFQSNSGAFEFLGSVKTPATVPHLGENGLPGEIQIAVRYTVELGAPDSSSAVIHVAGTDPDLREVLIPVSGTVNRAPLPQIAPLGVGSPGMEVTLDGSMSSDPDNDLPLTYKWTLASRPLGATGTVIEGPEQPVTRMTLDPKLPGKYEVELNVTDAAGAKNIKSARATIVAAPAEKLLIEMFWDNSQTDVDLHLLQDSTKPLEKAPGDCFYQNPAPDWGEAGIDTDDPAFERDALVGYGPEVIGYTNPPDGSKFRVVALYKATHGAAEPASKITVRIYEFGVVVFEQSRTLSIPGEVWPAADIDWPSGDVTALQP